MIRQEEVYRIGRIGKPHGVRGEVVMHIDDDVFDRVEADYLVLDIDGILVPFYMEEYRFRSNESVLMKFCDIDTVEQARQLTGTAVFFPRSEADEADEMPSWAALVGYTLTDHHTGAVAGEIVGIDDSTLNTLFEVRATDGKEILIPAAPELITGIDPDRKDISVAVPEGLIE